MTLISIDNLSFSYKNQDERVLNSISLGIPNGAILGLIGKNGAGKTTLLQLISGVLRPDSGMIQFSGESDSGNKIAYVPERPLYYKNFSLKEYLNYLNKISAKPKSQDRIEEVIRFVHLDQAKDKELKNFSKGMLQRVGLAQALLNDSQLFILDEPMSGLDLVGQDKIRKIITGIHKQGKTIIISSHNLYEIERLCTQMAILDDGNLKTVDKKEMVANREYKLSIEIDKNSLEEIIPVHIQKGITFRQGEIFFSAEDDQLYFKIIQHLNQNRIKINGLEKNNPSFERFVLRHFTDGRGKDE